MSDLFLFMTSASEERQSRDYKPRIEKVLRKMGR